MKGIVIIDNNQDKLNAFKNLGFQTLCMNVEDTLNYQDWMSSFTGHDNGLLKPIYYVSPANSLLFMDGGIDKSYMRMFENIQQQLKLRLKELVDDKAYNLKNSLLGRPYLPIGSAMCTNTLNINYHIISASTMLMPQPVKNTQNPYWAMKAILKVWPGNGTILIPPLACGYGEISVEESAKQMHKALMEDIKDEGSSVFPIMKEYANMSETEWNNYVNNFHINKFVGTIYVDEPNMDEQPNFYENSEFKNIDFRDIIDKPHGYFGSNS